MNISAEEFSVKVDAPENLKEMKEKARDLDKLTYLIKEQFSKCSGDKKNQLLMMAPSSWSVRKIKDFLKLLLFLWNRQESLQQRKSLLSYQVKSAVMYQKLPKAVEELVKGFFCDDEFSRQLPGKKYFY